MSRFGDMLFPHKFLTNCLAMIMTKNLRILELAVELLEDDRTKYPVISIITSNLASRD